MNIIKDTIESIKDKSEVVTSLQSPNQLWYVNPADIEYEINKLIKAFGNCDKCFGKGYATYKHSIDDGHTVTKPEVKMVPCTCNRGVQIKEILKDTDKLAVGIF